VTAGVQELLRLAREVAVEAGELAARLRREGVEVQATKSSPIDIVTAADRAAEDLIRARLAAARPADGFLGEESDAETGTSGITWVVDPIDGTVNYLYDLPNWSVSIAAVEGDPDPGTWRALAGAVAAPALGEVFTASTGGGAHLGERVLQVRPPAELDRALLSTGFHYTQAIRGNQARVAAQLIPLVRDLRRTGGAAIDLASVAAGRLDAFFEQGLNPWDQAAGGLLVTEAGGVVTGLDGAAPAHRMVIAGHPAVVRELDALLQRLGA
jgi:myo-inositol-1(or 4)-monophosphatase